jgi:hypothetical protein
MRRTKILVLSVVAVLMMVASYSVAAKPSHTGTVIDTVNGGGYTYMYIEEDGEKFWIAGPQIYIKSGVTVNFLEQVWMSNFNSKALGRTFDRILFVGSVIVVSSEAKEKVQVASPSKGAAAAAKTYTIKEIFSKKDKLKGQMVRVRGNVVKVSEAILGHNWVHIKDGTGGEGSDKIVFRSKKQTASVGSTVIAQGRFETDVDYGFGYFYPVVVEDASFTE